MSGRPVDEILYELERDHTVRDAVLSADDMLDQAQDQLFLFDRAVPRGGITEIVAPPESYKSWAAYWMVLCTARRIPWLGRPYVPHPTRPGLRGALVLNYDNPTPEAARRFKRLGLERGEPVWFHTEKMHSDAPMYLLGPGDKQLRMLVDALQPELVVIDSLRAACKADENSSQEMGEVMRSIKELRKHGASIVLLHHTGKSAGSGGRGTGEILASADAEWTVEPEEWGGTLVPTKTRGWKRGEHDNNPFEVVDVGAVTVVRQRERE